MLIESWNEDATATATPAPLVDIGGSAARLPQLGARGRRGLALTVEASVTAAVLLGLMAYGARIDALGFSTLLVTVLVASATSGIRRRADLLLARPSFEQVGPAIQLAALATFVFVGAEAAQGGDLPAQLLLQVLGAVTVGQLSAQMLGHVLLPRLCRRERGIVIGNAAARGDFTRNLGIAHARAVDIVAEFDDLPLGGMRHQFEHMGIDRVVVVVDGVDETQQALEIARLARAAGCKTTICCSPLAQLGSDLSVEQLGADVVFHTAPRNAVPLVKRGLDVFGASFGLLLTAPFFALMALLITLDTKGHVFFRQRRVGREGAEFWIYKFRTMVSEAEDLKDALHGLNQAEGGLFKIENDPRITRVGRFLRRTSLDELPQLLNVLRGEMSLVGPRPLVPQEDARIEGWLRARLRMSPGMTGPWQVMGSARIGMSDMARLDNMYVSDWTLMSDLRLLLQTALFVVRGRGL